MRVRPFVPTDANAVNSVAEAAFAQYEPVFRDWETLTNGIRSTASLASHGELIVVEDESGHVVGAVAYFGPHTEPRADFFDPRWPIIRMLVVDPAARGRGIGRRLIEECIEHARRDGAEVIALHTSPVMEVALGMYLRMGFRLKRTVPDRFGVPYGLYLKDLRESQ